MTDLTDTTAAFMRRLKAARRYNIGFPGATDFDYTDLAELLCTQLLNNVGDPYIDGIAANHTKSMEREVVDFCADLFRAPRDDRWGYVTTGGSEGNLYGLWLARSLHPDGVVYASRAAHGSIGKAVAQLAMPSIVVQADDTGVMDYADLADQVNRHRHRPAIIAATAGTTLSEAVDDLRSITSVLDELPMPRRYIHVDAALSGIPLALMPADQRPGFDFADGADSITISGHKYPGTPMPTGIVVTRRSYRDRLAATVGYAGAPDTTVGHSRSGHAPLLLWHTIRRLGIDGLRARADAARQLAAYTHRRLADLGWDSFRHPHAFTVVLRSPPPTITAKWVLASAGEWSHLITMPGIQADVVEEFLTDIAAAMPTAGTPLPVRQPSDPAALVEAQPTGATR